MKSPQCLPILKWREKKILDAEFVWWAYNGHWIDANNVAVQHGKSFKWIYLLSKIKCTSIVL